ncbi:Uncharacterised protein [Vibrio cholerae]|nr:Uncharacterised protein [Vibrio cholerae]
MVFPAPGPPEIITIDIRFLSSRVNSLAVKIKPLTGDS